MDVRPEWRLAVDVKAGLLRRNPGAEQMEMDGPFASPLQRGLRSLELISADQALPVLRCASDAIQISEAHEDTSEYRGLVLKAATRFIP